MAVAGRRGSPWARLADMPHITVRFVDLAPHGVRGVCIPGPGGTWVIALDRSLPRAERTATLAHELAHIAAGGGADRPGMPDTWAAVVARTETAADRVVAEELVPAAVLDAWLADAECVTAEDVAAEWEVPVSVAAWALEGALIRARLRGGPVGVLAAAVAQSWPWA